MKKDFPKIIGLFMYPDMIYGSRWAKVIYLFSYVWILIFIEICLRNVYALNGREKKTFKKIINEALPMLCFAIVQSSFKTFVETSKFMNGLTTILNIPTLSGVVYLSSLALVLCSIRLDRYLFSSSFKLDASSTVEIFHWTMEVLY